MQAAWWCDGLVDRAEDPTRHEDGHRSGGDDAHTQRDRDGTPHRIDECLMRFLFGALSFVALANAVTERRRGANTEGCRKRHEEHSNHDRRK
jgi:hypothetical protein